MSLIRVLILLSFSFFFSWSLHAYTFEASIDKRKVMLGEELNLTLVFTYENVKRDEIEEYEIEELHFDNINSTLITDEEYQENNSTWRVKQIYRLMPKQIGKLLIPSVNLYIESIPAAYQKVYNRNKYLEKVNLESKEIKLEVLSLPDEVTISGDYKLIATVDRKEVKLGQPIKFSVLLEGRGNLENLDFFKLKIPHTTIYSEPLTGESKNFTIVSDRNYTIPPLMLRYYNVKSHSIELIDTPRFEIEVDSDNKIKIDNDSWIFYGLWLIGLLLLSTYWLYVNLRNSFIQSLKRTKSKEDLLKKIVPYMEKSKNLKRLIFKLEISEKQTFKSLKKEIIKEIHLYTKEKK